MRTTLRLDGEIVRQAKTQAEARGISLTKFVEEAIREHLAKPASRPSRGHVRLPVSTASGGLAPGSSTLEEAVAAADLGEDRRRVP
jgi:hypothetical protein